jgi:hypothetical protein
MRTITEQGADAAYSTLLAYKTYAGTGTENVESNTISLLTNLMHLLGDYGFTVEEAMQEARMAYNEACTYEDCGEAYTCPKCYGKARDNGGVFYEKGEFDGDYYEEEGNADDYVCRSCGCRFFVA